MRLAAYVPKPLKAALKARLKQLRIAAVGALRSYGGVQLLQALRRLGVRDGDVVMLHSAFSREHGFRGSAGELIDLFLEAVGPSGHLLMVSMPYRNASLDWLQSGRSLDVRRTPSMMGLVSESFRRRAGVLRSVHPTHPVLAHGPRAESFIAGHADCVHPCGPGTPFDAVARADGVAVFYNVPLETFTFFHHLEHLVHADLPFPLYTPAAFDAPVIDAEGVHRTVRTYAFDRQAIARRRPERLFAALRQQGNVRTQVVGASTLMAIRVRDAIECTRQMRARGEYFYAMPSPAGHVDSARQ
ncbi:MAG: AAC(3) family N-acetyltransferase [Rubrivivax sp.]|nr:AAC(3) family N-acetyltransferase [Rubrivivax sp.]